MWKSVVRHTYSFIDGRTDLGDGTDCPLPKFKTPLTSQFPTEAAVRFNQNTRQNTSFNEGRKISCRFTVSG